MRTLKAKLSFLLVFLFAFTFFVGFRSMAAGNAVEEAKANVLTYEGMMARTVGNSGIRSLYRIDRASIDTLLENGYTVEIGASMGVAYLNGVAYNKVTDLTVKADAEKGYVSTAKGAGTVIVYSSEDAAYATNKYVSKSEDESKFAFTTIFSEEYENSTYYNVEFCYRGFVALTKDGTTEILYVDADGATFGSDISLYEIVSYFVSGAYQGEKAEEYASLPKFHSIVEAVRIFEYFPKDTVSADKLLSDKATLHVTTNEHAFTVKAARAGFYAVKMKYNAKNVQIGAVTIKNNTVSADKSYAGRIFPDILTYANGIPTDFVVPDADKNGVYQPDLSSSLMNTKYWGEGILYVYLAAGENSLSLTTNSSTGMGIYALQFILVDELSLDDRTTSNKFTFENTGKAYSAGQFTSSDGALVTTLSLNAGVYRVSGLVQVAPNTTFKVELLSGETVLGTASYKHPNGAYTWAAGSDNFAPLSLGKEITVPTSGEYTVRVSASGSYAKLSELYLTKVEAIPEAIGTPEVSVGNGVVSWEAIKGATAYAYRVNGGEVQTTTETSVTLESGDTVTVQALGNGKEYLDSAWSETVTYFQTVYEYFPKDTVSADKLLSDKETLHVTTNEHAFTVNVARAGFYAVKMKYNAKNAQVDAILKNKTVSADKEYKARIYPNILTYENGTPTDFVVPDADKNGVYQPDRESSQLMKERYWGEGILSVYLAAGENSLSLYIDSNSNSKEMGVYALQFILVDELSLDDRTTSGKFTFEKTGGAYNAAAFQSSNGALVTKISLNAGVYRVSSLVQVYSNATFKVEILSAETVLGTASYKHPNVGYYWAPGSANFAPLSLGEEITVPTAGEYTVRVSASGSSVVLSELYLTKVEAIPEAIGTPTVTVDEKGVASWEAIKGATAYAYRVNGGEVQTTTETSVTLESGDTVTVQALGNGEEYLDSAWSETVKYIQKIFAVDLATDLTASNGLVLQTEGTYKDYYLLTTNGTANYIEFKVMVTVAGLYAVSLDATVSSADVAQMYMTNKTDKGDGWASHNVMAQIQKSLTVKIGNTVGYQYLYEGENTLRFYLAKGSVYLKTAQLSLYWEDADAVKQVMSESVATKPTAPTGESGFKKEAGCLYLRGTDTNASTANIALPRVPEAADYTVYIVGSAYLSNKSATFAFSNGQSFAIKPSNKSAYGGDNHWGAANLYELGTVTLKNNEDYTLTPSVPILWFGIHAIYLVKTGEYSGEKETLATPTVSVNGTGIASWEAIPNADGYEYILDGGEPVVTKETSLVLKNGQTFTVRTLGSGAYASSEYSELLTYVPAPATEWEYDLANADLYTRAETLSYADGYLYMPAGEANYIEFTVNAAKAGFYDISYIGKAIARGRLKHQNCSTTEDGWSSHTAGAEFLGGTTQADFTRATSQYLKAGPNKIRIYVYDGNYYASRVKISLAMEEPENTVHMIVNSSNAWVEKYSDNRDDGMNAPGGHGTPGSIWGRGGSQLGFTLPRFAEGGIYRVYAVGANASTDSVSFDLMIGGATVDSTSYRNKTAASQYHQVNVYEIGELTIAPETDYTLIAYPNGGYFSFHRFFFVKIGELPNEMSVGDLSLDPVNHGVNVDVLLSGADYNYITMVALDANGELIRAVYGEKSGASAMVSLSIALSESESAVFDSVKIFPTAAANSTTPISEEAVYHYYLENTITATAYTANKESGEFSAKVDFTSFHYQNLALVLLNESGNVIATARATDPDYVTLGTTLSVTLAPAVAATVADMKVIMTASDSATDAVPGTSSFTYRFVNDLRLLFVSDLHYSVMQGSTGRYGGNDGLSGDGRAQHFVDSILAENAAGGVDAVFFLGDLTSSEDWYKRFDSNCKNYHYSADRDIWNSTTNSAGADGVLNLDDYYASKYDAVYQLQTKYLSQLEAARIPVYCIPGNHDTVDNGHWERTFGYKEKFGYTETEYIVRFPEQKTAVVMLNTFDTSIGAMDTARGTPGNTYQNGKEQTLGYTPVKEALLIAFLDELVAEGYESVYVAAHDMITVDAALLRAAEEYPFITAYMYGDHHVDTVGTIGGVPAFIEGHYMSPLFEYVGENGERLYDHQRLPFSYVIAEKHGDVATFDYKKMETVHLAKDNYDFMSKYFVLTEVDAQGENTLILTRIIDTVVSDGKTTNTVYAGYYHFEMRTDLSDADRATAERIAWLIETYDMNIFTFSRGNTGVIPDGMQTSTETWWTDANGKFHIEGNATDWCYTDMQVSPNYTSFYREKATYKSYEIVDNGKARQTFVDEDEVTMTNKK